MKKENNNNNNNNIKNCSIDRKLLKQLVDMYQELSPFSIGIDEEKLLDGDIYTIERVMDTVYNMVFPDFCELNISGNFELKLDDDMDKMYCKVLSNSKEMNSAFYEIVEVDAKKKVSTYNIDYDGKVTQYYIQFYHDQTNYSSYYYSIDNFIKCFYSYRNYQIKKHNEINEKNINKKMEMYENAIKLIAQIRKAIV